MDEERWMMEKAGTSQVMEQWFLGSRSDEMDVWMDEVIYPECKVEQIQQPEWYYSKYFIDLNGFFWRALLKKLG